MIGKGVSMHEEHVSVKYNRVKVFSATRARDRATLGDRVTEWLKGYNGEIMDKVVKQSSDHAFHCLSVTFFCMDPKPRRTRRKNGG